VDADLILESPDQRRVVLRFLLHFHVGFLNTFIRCSVKCL
jgi:hypothetical protein